MPNDVALLDMMLDWVPDEKIRKLIFVDNPAEVFGFPAAAVKAQDERRAIHSAAACGCAVAAMRPGP